jgi:demethylmenaquinone methyltransferase / 2-methoxy-6-polyprenyl-1,4-benzoquinol methylase
LTGSSEAGDSSRPGLHAKWKGVVDSLEAIIPIYEKGSSRISLFSDKAMRDEVASFAVAGERGLLVLDLGAGPGTLSRVVARSGGSPVLADASRKMLSMAPEFDRVQCVFEFLPFRPGAFGAAVAGFSLRDSQDLETALTQIRQAIRPAGRFASCDLGKPASKAKAALVGGYIRVAPPLIGFLTGGRSGLRFGSLHDTYRLVLDNKKLCGLLSSYFGEVAITERRMGASVVVRCAA